MNKFENVSILTRANIYFDGGVTSRTIEFPNGEIKTLGIMLPGEYTFNTGKKEIMDVISGQVEVLLPDEKQWRKYSAGDNFEVKANASFQIKVTDLMDYCCSFID